MEKIKTILDRKPLSSEYIRSKQDFGKVMKSAQGTNAPIWKSQWFYGTVGVATVAIVVTVVTLTGADNPIDQNQSQPRVVTASSLSEVDNQQPDNSTEVLAAVSQEEKEETPTVKTVVKEEPKEEVKVERKKPEENTTITQKQIDEAKEEAKSANELGVPNISGISSGPISFKDFCNPLGLQVSNGIIFEYTIQYRSCARDVTYKVRGNKIPQTVCNEIQDCGSNIEISFVNIKTQSKDGSPVYLKNFSVVTTL